MAAGLLIEMLRDPGLCDIGEIASLERSITEVRDGAALLEEVRQDPLQAALIVSKLPSMPLREAPWPFDDQRDWASVGDEDLRHYARFSSCPLTVAAAEKELLSRSGQI